jgi:polysaccharide export outer membrane protein
MTHKKVTQEVPILLERSLAYMNMRAWTITWRLVCGCILLSLSVTNVSAQQPGNSNTDSQAEAPVAAASSTPSGGPSSGSATGSLLRKGNPAELGPPVRIGPGDDLDITVFGFPDLTQHARVGDSGEVSLPLLGNVRLAGLSSDEAQSLIETRLSDGHFVNNPQVSVYVKEYTAEGISLMGEVTRPSVYSALGAHRLLDLIQTAGGLTEKAGKTVTVVHRDDLDHPIALTLSHDAARTAENNIELRPGDTVVVSRAGIVYVVGEVNRPGGFVIQDNKITASQILAMASGPTHLASLDGAKVIRHTPDGLKDIPLPLKKVLAAKTPDVELLPDDIIWVPSSKTAGIATSGTSTLLSTLAGLAIYRF